MKGDNRSSYDSSNSVLTSNVRSTMALIALVTVLAGTVLRAAYGLGEDVSKKVLKRHDRDARAMKREMKRYKKELEKERKRGP